MKIRGIDIGVKPCPFCGCVDIDYLLSFGKGEFDNGH
jgi:hypothetical protein